MNLGSNDLFARAALPMDQDGKVGPMNLLYFLPHHLHLRSCTKHDALRRKWVGIVP
jgi:hypothetical protein